MKIIPIVLFCLVLFWSCKPDGGVILNLSIVNSLDEEVQILIYYFPVTGTVPDTIKLMSNEVYSENREDDRGGGFDDYPTYLHESGFPNSAVVDIVFRDSLTISHVKTLSSTVQPMPEIIYFDNPRNVYNPNSFTKEKIKEDVFSGTYSISQADLDYAISVYE
jgi:hypothetical protein